jgi:regulator of replication initiation timing
MITKITEKEQQLANILRTTTEALQAVTAERDALKANLHQVSLSHTHLHTENKVLRDALNNCEDALRNSQTVLGQPSSGFVRVCVDANDLALSIANAALQGRKA